MIIYKVTNIVNKKIYIGQTIHNLKKRKRQHENAHKYNNNHGIFDKAINKYGKENFLWEIIDTASSLDELNKKEEFYIKTYDSINIDIGYNLKYGGNNHLLSENIRKKIGNAQKGEKNHMYGKTGKNNKCSKKVINITTNIIYDSATICSEKENISLSHICAVCRGERATCNHNIYRYIDDNNNIINPVIEKKCKEQKVKNLDTNKTFNSLTEASIYYFNNKTMISNISKVCNKIRKTAGGYRWSFI